MESDNYGGDGWHEKGDAMKYFSDLLLLFGTWCAACRPPPPWLERSSWCVVVLLLLEEEVLCPPLSLVRSEIEGIEVRLGTKNEIALYR